MGQYISLDDVLGKSEQEIAAQKKDEFSVEKLGNVPFTALDFPEYKAAKKECTKMVPNGTGGMEPEIDDDQLMLLVIMKAVAKDDRSDFTFANKKLLAKLKVTRATDAVQKLMAPGEIYSAALQVQNTSGFSQQAKKENSEAVKNS